jgi:alpha-L-rhamnosidase
MQLNVPFNTKARIKISEEEQLTLKINGMNWDQFQVENKPEVWNKSMVVLGSGNYRIEYAKTNK